MDLIKRLKFYDTKQKCIIETKISLHRCFANYTNVTRPPGFSDCNFTPEPERYVPVVPLCDDMNGKQITNISEVVFHDPMTETREHCVIIYENERACFSLSFENGTIVPIFLLREHVEVVGCEFINNLTTEK